MASLNAIDRTEVEATTAAFEKLRASIEAVNAELDKLAGKSHGGITIKAVGNIVHCEVKPSDGNVATIRAMVEKGIQAELCSYAERRG